MRGSTTAIAIAFASTAFGMPDLLAADKFQKQTGAQIQARFSGMEMSDDVHWRDRYERNGTISSISMGKSRTGAWRIEKNTLCVEFPKEQGGCYEVWLDGSKVEFRHEDSDLAILEGKLQRPAAHR